MIKTTKVKTNAKINIGLCIAGREGEFHSLDTVVCGINVFDTVTVTTRRDKNINLDIRGCGSDNLPKAENNVYKAAAAFMNEFGTCGADIKLDKIIPVGSGLGGSSADIVGAVRAMARAYSVESDPLEIIRSLSSDGEFLYRGGCARLKGRGNIAESFVLPRPIYLLIAVPDVQSVTRDVFAEYDRGEYAGNLADIDYICGKLKVGDYRFEDREIFNALAAPAIHLHAEIGEIYQKVKDLSPDFISLSGSGSAVFAAFETPELCLWAKNKLRGDCQLFVAETI